jgi:uncharacterized protein YcbK (DUF882 family)
VISRRRVLASGLAGTALLCSRALFAAQNSVAPSAAASAAAKGIALANLHTGERLEIEYFRDGVYVPEAMISIEALLRDFRNGDKHPIDPKLMDYLVDAAAKAGKPAAYSVISGYRSPETNQRLHEQSSGVSQHSLHLQGRAIDVRLIGVDCKDLAGRAEELKRGGVGYYRASDFVHLDTGAFRTWRG